MVTRIYIIFACPICSYSALTLLKLFPSGIKCILQDIPSPSLSPFLDICRSFEPEIVINVKKYESGIKKQSLNC